MNNYGVKGMSFWENLFDLIKSFSFSQRIPEIIIEPLISEAFSSEQLKEVERLNEKASILYYQGRYSEAEELFQQVLELTKTTLGEEQPLVATTLNNLAGLSDVQGSSQKAKSFYQQAMTIALKTLGENHPQTQTIIKNYNQIISESESEPTSLN